MFEIFPLKAFTDNYIWALLRDDELTIVDPGDAEPVISFAQQKGLVVKNILITHHHFDHTGGIEKLVNIFNSEVYGPAGDHINGVNRNLTEGDNFEISNINFRVFSTPGHTLDHISFYAESERPLLFCGDTLFLGGCGRLFEGTSQQMFNSLEKFSSLPLNTQVFCAHEYTESNLTFAAEVEPLNEDLINKLSEVKSMRQQDKITLPSTIATELNINPFMRCHKEDVIKAAQIYSHSQVKNPDEVLGVIRDWKDNF